MNFVTNSIDKSITFILPSTDFGVKYISSASLTMINGRPALSWILQDLLKLTSDTIYLHTEDCDERIQGFVKAHCPPHSRIIFSAEACSSRDYILSVLQNIAETILCVRFERYDVLLSNVPFSSEDTIQYSRSFEIGRIEIQDPQQFISLLKTENFLNAVDLYFATKSEGKKKQVPDLNWIDFSSETGRAAARTKLIESRSFNQLRIHPLFPEITKMSSNVEKLQNEVFWYRELPSKFKTLAPQVLNFDGHGIRMEYYGYGTLTEKFLYADLSLGKWEKILRRLFGIVDAFSEEKFKADNRIFELFYCEKLQKRIEALRKIEYLSDITSAKEIIINSKKCDGLSKLHPVLVEAMSKIASSATGTICHGDMCFNNILYDLQTSIVKLIDPRGNIEGIPSVICDPRYDIAKLKHSFCGNYDGIVEGDFCVGRNKDNSYYLETAKDDSLIAREQLFKSLCIEFGYSHKEISIIEAYLFLTLIPLHTDSVEKMKAFFLLAILKLNKCFSEDSK